MFIEEIIECELRGLVVRVLRQMTIFTTKQKSPRKIFKWIIIYSQNIDGADDAP